MGTPRKPRRFSPQLALSPCVVLGLWGALVSNAACAGSDLARRTPVFSVTLGRSLPSVSGVEAPNAASAAARALRQRGLRFGTDGTPGGLYALMKYSHALISPGQARAGDLIFFDLGGGRCGEHVGVVEHAEATGGLRFREARNGELRLSHAHPSRPTERRDEDGRVLNTFLRPRRPGDPAGTRYFAGDMLCAVGRVDRE